MTMWDVKRRPECGVVWPQGSDRLPSQRAQEIKDLVRGAQLLDLRMQIHQKLIEGINLSALELMSRDQVAGAAAHVVADMLQDHRVALNRLERARLIDEVLDELLGLGPLEPLLSDDTISDILVNGCHKIYVERNGKLERNSARFQDERHLLRIIQKIVGSVGRRIDESCPFADARLADGSRINAIIAPLAVDGSLLSIRKFARTPIDLHRMVELGSIPKRLVPALRAIVEARLNIVISGGTGSGKTTLLNALSGFIKERERIITIEDSAELRLQNDHVARLETRPMSIEGKGEITQRDLLKNALRMRPDRIIIGECRSGEAFDMLQAMNSGHDGSITTVHANTPRDALSRIEQMVGMSDVAMKSHAVRSQIASAVHIVLQIARFPDGCRRLVSLSEITGIEGEMISIQELFRFKAAGRSEEGSVIGKFEATGIQPKFTSILRDKNITMDLKIFNARI
jgi:pilus assembly protein CpaF